MKKKATRKTGPSHSSFRFDSTEFLLLASVTLVLLVYFAWQTHLLPTLLANSVLGAATAR